MCKAALLLGGHVRELPHGQVDGAQLRRAVRAPAAVRARISVPAPFCFLHLAKQCCFSQSACYDRQRGIATLVARTHVRLSQQFRRGGRGGTGRPLQRRSPPPPPRARASRTLRARTPVSRAARVRRGGKRVREREREQRRERERTERENRERERTERENREREQRERASERENRVTKRERERWRGREMERDGERETERER